MTAVVRDIRRALVLAALVILAGCEQAPAPAPTVAAPTGAAALRAEGDALVARGDYAGGAAKYEAALKLEPEDVGLHFALGSALSFLTERRADTIREFKWVVERGKPDSSEVRDARRWLVKAGLLQEETVAEGADATTTTQARAPGVETGLKGKVEWKGVTPEQSTVAVRLTLTGEDMGNRNFKQGRLAKITGQYFFPDAPPGTYRLTVSAVRPDTPLWDLRVTIEAGKATVLDLNNGNSSAPPDALSDRHS